MSIDHRPDVDLIQQIDAIPSILNVVCQITGMGFATIARVTQEQWIACSVKDQIEFGLKPGDELKLDTTICNDVRIKHTPIIIDNVEESPEFFYHPATRIYNLKSYVSMPIILADRSFFGTLCAFDYQPRHLSKPEIVEMFRLFAELVGFHIDAVRKLGRSAASMAHERAVHGDTQRRLDASEAQLTSERAIHSDTAQRLNASEASLLDARAASELREQFIAVLGHDLRNPLSAISGAAYLIAKTPLDDKTSKLLTAVQSSVMRMARLIDNILDFARGRLGSGLTLSRDLETGIEAMLRQVVSEIRIIAPERTITAEYVLNKPVDCDRARLAQLFSNLLGNALTHGATDTPIRIQATTTDRELVLSVANGGQPIPPAALERLFQPFYRGEVRPSQQGLGLGLFISSEIARAHCGVLSVASNESETRFTLTMPLVQEGRDDLERPD